MFSLIRFIITPHSMSLQEPTQRSGSQEDTQGVNEEPCLLPVQLEAGPPGPFSLAEHSNLWLQSAGKHQ
ncbi:hypothetical protein UPYG_G00156790 [Umbra pygmaea]|uniref:Uncharacterized protein n=1 Tax=Umbra pygmaea TaxID=75934 RepID=A0ABD0WYE2_UMBPY